MNSFYEREELLACGFKEVGDNVMVSRKASIYSPSKISLGSNVRIDDFCILSGKIQIGSYVHIAAYSALYGGDVGIFMDDFVNLSSRVSIYAISDDYSGDSLTSPLIMDKYKHLISKAVYIHKHAIIGATSVVLPGVTIQEGSSFGAMSLVLRDSEPWSIYVGIPARKIKDRNKKMLDLESDFLKEINCNEK